MKVASVAGLIAALAVWVASLAPGLTPARAGADGGAAPFPVTAASVSQDGQQIIWRVELSHAFSAIGLKRYRRALCLLIEPRHAPGHSLCVVPGDHGIALRYGPSHKLIDIAATISRSGPDELSASFRPAAIAMGYESFRWQVFSAIGGTNIEFPSRPAFTKLHTPRLVGCVPSGPNWVFSGPSNVHAIALTFDDGPWVLTPALVSLLARYGVPATFFQIGEWISKYGENGALERRMLADGDMIGNHTWTHPDMDEIPASQWSSQLRQANDAIQKATGFRPCLWRAPYGIVNPALLKLARRMGYATIQWDVDPRDWALPGVAEIEDNIIDNAHNGALIEEHDGGGPRQETLDALPDVIETLKARGYKFETVTQMLGYRLVYK